MEKIRKIRIKYLRKRIKTLKSYKRFANEMLDDLLGPIDPNYDGTLPPKQEKEEE